MGWDSENDIMSSICQHILNLLVKQLGKFPNIISVLNTDCGKSRIKSGFRIIRIFYIGVIVPLVIKNTPIITSIIFKYVDWLNRFLEKCLSLRFFLLIFLSYVKNRF